MKRASTNRVRLLAMLQFASCTAPVAAPSEVHDPVAVFVLREALHTGLVLPPDAQATVHGDAFVEFGFGDWQWYACGDDAWYRVFETVLLPTQGALGRRVFAAHDEASLRRAAYWAQLDQVLVERSIARELRASLQRAFDARPGARVAQPRYRFEFVPDDGFYWCWSNCNDRVAVWLAQLGCDVGWRPIVTSLELAPRR